MGSKSKKKVTDIKAERRSSIESLEKLTDVEVDYPLVYSEDISPLGGKYTTEERYPISEMLDGE